MLMLLDAERQEIRTYVQAFGDGPAFQLRPEIWGGLLLPAIDPIVLAETGTLAAIGCLLTSTTLPQAFMGTPLFVSRQDLDRIVRPAHNATKDEVIAEALEIVASVPPSSVMLKADFFNVLRLRCGDANKKLLEAAWVKTAPSHWRAPGRRRTSAIMIG